MFFSSYNFICCIAVDGSWGDWADWSECSSSCNFGQQFRRRTCDNPAPQYGGVHCPGQGKGDRLCFLLFCPRKLRTFFVLHGRIGPTFHGSACFRQRINIYGRREFRPCVKRISRVSREFLLAGVHTPCLEFFAYTASTEFQHLHSKQRMVSVLAHRSTVSRAMKLGPVCLSFGQPFFNLDNSVVM